MAKTISYTNTSTSYTVKPTRTPITNSTDKALTLNYQTTSESVDAGKTVTVEKTIISITYTAKILYASGGPNYVIPAGSKAVIKNVKGGDLTLTIS
jgi:hypothetical protein